MQNYKLLLMMILMTGCGLSNEKIPKETDAEINREFSILGADIDCYYSPADYRKCKLVNPISVFDVRYTVADNSVKKFTEYNLPGLPGNNIRELTGFIKNVNYLNQLEGEWTYTYFSTNDVHRMNFRRICPWNYNNNIFSYTCLQPPPTK